MRKMRKGGLEEKKKKKKKGKIHKKKNKERRRKKKYTMAVGMELTASLFILSFFPASLFSKKKKSSREWRERKKRKKKRKKKKEKKKEKKKRKGKKKNKEKNGKRFPNLGKTASIVFSLICMGKGRRGQGREETRAGTVHVAPSFFVLSLVKFNNKKNKNNKNHKK